MQQKLELKKNYLPGFSESFDFLQESFSLRFSLIHLNIQIKLRTLKSNVLFS